MLHSSYSKYILDFKKPSWTSRGVLNHKETYFIRIVDASKPFVVGLGECAVFRGLGSDDVPDYEKVLAEVCWNIEDYKDCYKERLKEYPSVVFGLETAFADLQNDGRMMPFPSDFTEGNGFVKINGLIWMDAREEMMKQIENKIEDGFSCVKMKIGAVDFESELDLLRSVRKRFSKESLELRVDANGAFSMEDAMMKLEALSKMDLHSIEQPIKAGQTENMASLCKDTPLPIALDEELIGVFDKSKKQALLDEIKPQFVVLKPSLHGSFCGVDEWIGLAEERKIGWWITSALESNIGLNAIAQWTYVKGVSMAQGLGTGSLYTNNVHSPLVLDGENLKFDETKVYDFKD